MNRVAAIALILASLTGCAASLPGLSTTAAPSATTAPSTAHGETYIVGASRKTAFDALATTLSKSGWRVASANDYQLTLEADARGAVGFMSELTYGVGKQPVYRLIATGEEDGGGAILRADVSLVNHAGTAREAITPLRGRGWADQAQAIVLAARDQAMRTAGH